MGSSQTDPLNVLSDLGADSVPLLRLSTARGELPRGLRKFPPQTSTQPPALTWAWFPGRWVLAGRTCMPREAWVGLMFA